VSETTNCEPIVNTASLLMATSTVLYISPPAMIKTVGKLSSNIPPAVNKVTSVMGRDDSWPATVPSVVPTGDCFH